MQPKKGAISSTLAAAIICLVLGGAAGYFARFSQEESFPANRPADGAGGGGMGGGGMLPPPGTPVTTNIRALTRLVGALSVIQKVQNAGMTPEQAKSLAATLKSLQSADKIVDADAEKKVAEIENLLTDEQKTALAALTAGRGGRGGGAGGGPAPAAAGGAPTVPVPVSAGGGPAGPPPDPEKPFAQDRNREALESLLAAAEAKAK